MINFPGMLNNFCVSLVYSGNGTSFLFRSPLYTRETQKLFNVPVIFQLEINLNLKMDKIEFLFRIIKNPLKKAS
jgi:hypothetical protein